MTTKINELTKGLVNKELQMFWKYQVDAKIPFGVLRKT
jgi:hypothetical protein